MESPYKIRQTSNEDVVNINMMTEADDKVIILVKGYKIHDQLQEKQSSDGTLDGAMNISLSQECSDIFCYDHLFLKICKYYNKIKS